MHIDVGTVSEDQMRSPDVPPDGLLNTEDRNQDGTLDVTSKNEDTGVDGLLDIDEPGPKLDLVTATDQDPHGDDYQRPGDEWLRGGRGRAPLPAHERGREEQGQLSLPGHRGPGWGRGDQPNGELRRVLVRSRRPEPSLSRDRRAPGVPRLPVGGRGQRLAALPHPDRRLVARRVRQSPTSPRRRRCGCGSTG